MDPLSQVVETTRWVCENSPESVKLNTEKLEDLTSLIAKQTKSKEGIMKMSVDGFLPGLFMDWGTTKDTHFKKNVEDPEWTAYYIFVLSTLNFCFWPIKDFEYKSLAKSLKTEFEKKKKDSPLSVENLSKLDTETLRKILFEGKEDPMISERLRLLKEVGHVLLSKFSGRVSNLIKRANKEASKLVELTTAYFPGFRDHVVHNGRQIFFYKRAQIFCADLYGAFDGSGLGEFEDMSRITMFPDYRVPQLFDEFNVLKYSKELSEKLAKKSVLKSGSVEEIEIRAFSVYVVERLKDGLKTKHKIKARAQEIDWWLWEKAENEKGEYKKNHHRILTIYY